ncbi:MAG: hypothetical protein HY941_01880 [Gammaproteobacteria bacterium]|nr:hypothetical protein [Gammaproteobacteria bacterium]
MDELQRMEFRYFLDWCPVSTLPVQNGLWKADALTGRSVRDIENPELEELFDRYPELVFFEYALRLDGLFVFRIGLFPGALSSAQEELPNELSDIVKAIAGHKHDFHDYPYPAASVVSSGAVSALWRKTCSWCARGFRSIVRRLYPAAYLRHQLDVDLHIRPIEIEDPFAEGIRQETRRDFVALSEVADPHHGDASMAQLRVRHANGDGLAQRACLRLRALFAGKKERCLIAYHRRRLWLNSLVPAMIYGLFVMVLLSAGLYVLFQMGWKTLLAIASVGGFGVFITLGDRLQAPKFEVIQRTLGFYAYANIYSMLTENMYRSTLDGPKLNSITGNFRDLTDALKARLELERLEITNRRYTWTIVFALIATTVALTKLSIELERLTEDNLNRNATQVIHPAR